MKCLDETPADISKRMRKLAGGMTNPADAEAIMRYASWIEANLDDVELQDLGEQFYKPESQKRQERHSDALHGVLASVWQHVGAFEWLNRLGLGEEWPKAGAWIPLLKLGEPRSRLRAIMRRAYPC